MIKAKKETCGERTRHLMANAATQKKQRKAGKPKEMSPNCVKPQASWHQAHQPDTTNQGRMAADRYDVCVVGAGLTGFAAAKYATFLDQKVCIIGQTRTSSRSMVVRKLHSSPFWMTVAARSLERYASMSKGSGITVRGTNSGILTISEEKSPYLKDMRNLAKAHGLTESLSQIPGNKMRGKYPSFNPILGMEAVLESGDSVGVLDSAKLLEAQKTLFLHRGGKVVEGIVTQVKKKSEHYEIQTKDQTITSEKVFLCVGPHIYHQNLLPTNMKLDLIFVGSTSLSIPFPSREDVREDLRKMPVVHFVSERNYDAGIKGEPLSFWLVPEQPDGSDRMTVSYAGQLKTRVFREPKEITKWLEGADDEAAGLLFADVKKFVNGFSTETPDLKIRNAVSVCTPGDLPYIDCLDAEGLYIFTGDSGMLGPYSDEVGRLLALWAIEHMWDMPDEIPQKWFKARKRLDPRTKI